MARSKDIADYIEAKLEELRPGEVITFDIYLYFAQNRHVMLWRKREELITDGFLDKYRQRGIERIWIHRTEIEAYYAYLNPEKFGDQPTQAEASAPKKDVPVASEASSSPDAPAPEPAMAESEAASPPVTLPRAETDPSPAQTLAKANDGESSRQTLPAPSEAHEPLIEMAAPATITESPQEMAPAREKNENFRTEAGEHLVELMKTTNVPEKQKAALAAMASRTILSRSANATTLAEQEEANQEARHLVQDILDHLVKDAHSVAQEIWKLSRTEPDLVHAVNVATYSIIFAMAFGRIDPQLIADIALAGLLHDVGICEIPSDIIEMPWKRLAGHSLRIYSRHVAAGMELIELYGGEDVPARPRAILSQHHEKFDGSGYPQGLNGFKVNDISQLLAMADLLDSVSSGQWDGKPRTLFETFETLETVERSRTFPEHFNPEVFASVMKWVRSYSDQSEADAALKVVEGQINRLVNQAA